MTSKSQEHMIRRQVLDLHLTEEKQAKELQDFFSRVYSRELAPLIESVLDEFSHEEEMIRFDRLEIDLGEVDPAHLLPNFKHKLRLALRQRLASQISQKGQILPVLGDTLPKRMPLVQAKLSVLIHFLQFGYLSPWARGKEMHLRSLLDELIKNQPDALKGALQEIGRQVAVIQRLHAQFSSEQLLAIEQLFFQGQTAFFDRSIQEWEQLLEQFSHGQADRANRAKVLAQTRLQFVLTSGSFLPEKSAWILTLGKAVLPTLPTSQIKPILEAWINPESSFLSTLSQPELSRIKEELLSQLPNKEQEKEFQVGNQKEPEEQLSMQAEDARHKESQQNFQKSDEKKSRQRRSVPDQESKDVEQPEEALVLSDQAQIDLLIHYLADEQWPWWAATRLQEELPEGLMQQLIQEKPSTIRTSLFEPLFVLAKSDSNKSKRMIEQLGEVLPLPLRMNLLELWLPDVSGFLFLLNQFITETSEGDSQLQSIFWKSVWEYTFSQSLSAFRLDLFLRTLLPALAHTQQQSAKELLQHFHKHLLQYQQQGNSRFASIQTILMGINADSLSATKTKERKNVDKEGDPDFEEFREPLGDALAGDKTERQEVNLKRSDDAKSRKKSSESPPEVEIGSENWIQQKLQLISHFFRFGSLPSDASLPSQKAFEDQLEQLVSQAPKHLAQLFDSLIQTPRIRKRIIHRLSEASFQQVIQLLPGLQGSDLFAHFVAFSQLTEAQRSAISLPLLKEELLRYLLANQGKVAVPYQYIDRVMKELLRTGVPVEEELIPQLVQETEKLQSTLKEEMRQILQVQAKEFEGRTKASLKKRSESPQPPISSKKLGDMPIDVSNAGLVLIWPFLSHFFKMLGFLTPTRKFKEEALAIRSVHLLQYIVRKSTSDPEEQLPLNKLLCGLPLSTPIDTEISISKKEAELAEGMLQAVCSQWKAMKNGTPDGLRGSFLIREGSLELKGKNWELTVEKKAFDMLLDYLPWSISMVKLPWMDGILQVDWR